MSAQATRTLPGRPPTKIVPKPCARSGCTNMIPIGPWDRPGRYAAKKFCSHSCSSRAQANIPNWPPTKEVLEELVGQGLTDTEIGKRLGVKKSAICHKRHEFGLEPGGWKKAPKRPLPQTSGAQTVEEYLAKGGVVTKCPTAFLLPSQHADPDPEDAAAHAARGSDPIGGAWSQRKTLDQARRIGQLRSKRGLYAAKAWETRRKRANG